jgi:hypothetical protein
VGTFKLLSERRGRGLRDPLVVCLGELLLLGVVELGSCHGVDEHAHTDKDENRDQRASQQPEPSSALAIGLPCRDDSHAHHAGPAAADRVRHDGTTRRVGVRLERQAEILGRRSWRNDGWGPAQGVVAHGPSCRSRGRR